MHQKVQRQGRRNENELATKKASMESGLKQNISVDKDKNRDQIKKELGILLYFYRVRSLKKRFLHQQAKLTILGIRT